MPEYQIKLVELTDPKQEELLLAFQRSAAAGLPSGIFRQTGTSGNTAARPLALAAYQENTLAGFAAALPHELLFNGEIVTAFQLIHSGAQRLVPELITELTGKLKANGAAFLFHFSRGQTDAGLKSMGFTESGFFQADVAKSALKGNQALSNWPEENSLLLYDTYLQNDYQLLQLRGAEFKERIQRVEYYHNLIWGVTDAATGIFHVGGMVINNPHLFRTTVEKVFEKPTAQSIRFMLHQSSRYNLLFSKTALVPANEVLLTYDLERKVSDNQQFTFMAGLNATFGTSFQAL
jgi:hypothetical protein